MRILTAVLALAIAAGASGCAERGTKVPPGSPQTPSATPSTSVQTEPTAGELTLRGRVEAGIEGGCLVLHTDKGDYLLFGATQNVKAGDEVEVTGQVTNDVASICQQGTPFMVESIKPR